MTRPRAKALLAGRGSECESLDRLLAAAHQEQSAVLVVRGGAGIGKSALLDYAAERAEGCRVCRAVGAEWEMELPFAGLHQLCVGLLDGRDGLPAPQRDALEIAFGLSSGAQPDRFLVSLAVLSLLSGAAAECPLVCLVDDVQWLDRSSAQVLAFVARRLAADSVVLLFAERGPGGVEELDGLSELRLEGLPDAHARELLASVITAPLDESVRARILAETRGNPLALLELPRDFSPRGLAGGFGFPSDGSLSGRIEASFRRRVEQLPPATQRLLLVAAADPTGEPALLVRASGLINVPMKELSPAEAGGLLELGSQVAFRHPLLRSVIYRAAASEARHAAHQALADATDAELDPDRRAWHRAHAIVEPDEDVALELEQSAERARARGGLAAAAAFLERSAALTPDPTHRAHRALEAAASEQLAGASQEALGLLARAAAGPLDPLDHARLKLLHGQIEVDLSHGPAALPLLLDAARQLEPLDPSLSRDAYLAALRAASVAGRLGPGMLEIARAALQAPRVPDEPRAVDLLVDGLAVRFTDGYAASVPALKRALTALREEGERKGVSPRWPWFARRVAGELFADDTWHYLTTRSVQVARENGALAVLPLALNHRAHLCCLEGDLDGARALLDEADGIAVAIGTEPLVFGRLPLAGFRGIEADAVALFEAAVPAAISRGGEGVVLTFSEHARAVLYNGLGRYEAALAPAQEAGRRDELLVSVWSLPELVEAATRCGQTDVASAAIEQLSERTSAAGTELALGIEARSRALLSEGALAERLYGEAIDRLGRSRMAFELARARLLYGEWLRRDRRRIDGREQLRAARDMFTSMGAEAFAARAGRELLATGETARKRRVETSDELTAQEMQIAQLARGGLSNPEIGARLFISPRTVEYCLRRLPIAALVNNFPGAAIPGVIDGAVLHESIGAALAAGRFARVPILNGITHDEELIFTAGLGTAVSGGTFVPVPEPVTAESYQRDIAAVLGVPAERAAAIAAEYPLGAYPLPAAAFSVLVSDANFACPALQVDRWTSRRVPTFAYQFDDDNAPQRFAPPGALPPVATHSAEVQYLFNQPNAPVPGTLTADQQQLAARMRDAWTSFAAAGDPSTAALPWPSSHGGARVMSLVPPQPRLDAQFASTHHCAFWGVGAAGLQHSGQAQPKDQPSTTGNATLTP